MDYLPSSYLLLLYSLWTYYACLCSSKGGLPLILLFKNLCFSMSIMWATWALKRGYGHLDKSNFGPELQHIQAQLHLWPHMGTMRTLPGLAAQHQSTPRDLSFSRTTYLHGRWGHACKASISEDWDPWNRISFALFIDYFIEMFWSEIGIQMRR